MRPETRRSWWPAIVLVAVSGCGGENGPPPTPSGIAVVSGSGQTGVAGQAPTQPIVAKVTSQGGAGVENVTVTFTPTAASGTVSPTTATTNADGIASAAWTLGTVSGDGQNGVAGQALTDQLSVLVKDHYGNPAAGSPVAWSVTAGGRHRLLPLGAGRRAGAVVGYLDAGARRG